MNGFLTPKNRTIIPTYFSMDSVAYLEAMRFVARQHFPIYSLPYREGMPLSLPPGPSHSHVSDSVPHKTKTSLGNLIGGALPAIPLWIHIAQSKQRGSLTPQRNRRVTRAIDSDPLTRGPKSDPLPAVDFVKCFFWSSPPCPTIHLKRWTKAAVEEVLVWATRPG